MSTNIQKPVSVPVADLIKQFGSYFAMNSRPSFGEPCKTSENIGNPTHYTKAPQFSDAVFELATFANYESLELNVVHYYENQVKYYTKLLDDKTLNIAYLFKLVLNKFGFFKEFYDEVNEIKKWINKNKYLSQNPFKESPIKQLSGTVEMPQYLLENNKYYYYPSYYNTKIIIRRMKVAKEDLCKVERFYKEYQYSVSYVLIDADDPRFTINYEHVKLTHFDGVKWSSHFDDDLLFVNEEDAKNYVKGQCQKSMSEISD